MTIDDSQSIISKKLSFFKITDKTYLRGRSVDITVDLSLVQRDLWLEDLLLQNFDWCSPHRHQYADRHVQLRGGKWAPPPLRDVRIRISMCVKKDGSSSAQTWYLDVSQVLDDTPVLGGLLFGSCVVLMTYVVLNLLLSVILVAFHEEQIHHKVTLITSHFEQLIQVFRPNWMSN